MKQGTHEDPLNCTLQSHLGLGLQIFDQGPQSNIRLYTVIVFATVICHYELVATRYTAQQTQLKYFGKHSIFMT